MEEKKPEEHPVPKTRAELVELIRKVGVKKAFEITGIDLDTEEPKSPTPPPAN